MKILLINPWQKSLFGDEKVRPGHPHLGLAYLVAVLKQHNFNNIEVFDQGLEDDEHILFAKISKQKPDLIGITSFSYCIDYAVKIINEIKAKTKTPIILGGAHVSAVKGEALHNTSVDFAMYGECEKSFIHFLEEFSGNRNYNQVGNLIWRNKAGEVVINEPTPFITDLDEIPFPDLNVFQFERYNYSKTGTLPIITSRGCPYSCNYCSVKLSMGRAFRSRSPQNVVAEMKHWIKTYGIKRFEFNDDCFTLDMNRAEAICDLIISEQLNIKYEMYNGIRADRVSKKLLQKMKDSGCVFVSYGCESGNQSIIINMGKSLKLDKVIEAVELTNEIGIKNSVNFIFGHKGETYQNAMETIEFAKKLPTNFVNFYNVIPYPGTDLYDWMKKEACQLISDEEYLSKVGSRDKLPVFETNYFNKEERIKAFEKGNALYEKTVLNYRFGIFFGFLAYMVSRNRMLFKIGRKIALDNPIGFKIYSLITMKSRKT